MSRVAPRILFIAMMFVLSSCDKNVNISNARVIHQDNEMHISVDIAGQDANYIKDSQIYAGFSLIECGNESDKYPFDALIDGLRSPEYPSQLNDKAVRVEGVVPNKIYENIRKPCVILEGGSYFSGKIHSNAVPLH